MGRLGLAIYWTADAVDPHYLWPTLYVTRARFPPPAVAYDRLVLAWWGAMVTLTRYPKISP